VSGEDPSQNTGPDEASTSPVVRPRLLWIAVAVLAVLALVGGIAWSLRPQPVAGSVPAATPKQAVTGFLEALAGGDADRALEFALTRPTDTTLLTRTVLEASHADGALAIVNVPEVAGTDTVQVPAEVTLGGKPATIAFAVTQTAPGWRLAHVTSTIDPGPLPASLGPTLSGQPLLDTSHLEVFPGLYTFGDSVPEIAFDAPQVVVDVVGEDIRAGLQPALTKVGVKTANAIASAAVDDCMAKQSPNPAGCPNSVKVAPGQKIKSKTIKWTLIGDPWKNATYTLDVTDPTRARGATSLTFRFRCTMTQKGETYQVDQVNPPVGVKYLLTVTDPKAPVTWQRVS